MSEPNKDVVMHMLLSIRSAADALLTLLADEPVSACKHANKEIVSGFGEPESWLCHDCHYTFDSAEAKAYEGGN